MNPTALLLAAGLSGCATPAQAAAQPTDWGTPAQPQEARRTVRITMSDDLRFTPSIIEVGHDETVRFEIRNLANSAHEMVIGTRQALEERAARKAKAKTRATPATDAPMPPWATRVAPGQVGTIVWNFSRAGTFHFGCLDDGHYAAGMTGQIRVVEPAGHKH
jgi:uncharacterized cupredoxin-like copper-binding protein